MSDLDDIARLVNPQADQAQTAARQWAGQVAAFWRGVVLRGWPMDRSSRDWPLTLLSIWYGVCLGAVCAHALGRLG